MFQEKYKAMNEQIVPDQMLVNETIKRINEQAKPETRAKPFYRKPIAIAAMFLVCIFTAMPVLAANVPVIYELMYQVSPSTVQFFMPVQKSCEANGIKMEVVATYIHKDTAEVYITLQDLTGNRVDETTDLNDSYSIHRPFDSSATCQRIGYNQETKTATFLIKITEWKNHNIEGDKLTFSVGNFISDKHEYEEIPIEINLGTVINDSKAKEVSLSGSSGIHFDEKQMNNMAKVMVPSEVIYSPVKGINVTGIGYVDDMLHIQTSVTNLLKNDNHGYFFLKDKKGNKIESDYSVKFIEYGEPGNEDTRVDYNEYVFNIPKSEITNYTLNGSFYTSGLYTEGGWQVTFPLVESEKNS